LIYRKLSPTGDYVLGRPNEFWTDADAVAQAIYTSLKLLQGEWWEDTSAGFPLFQVVLDTPGSPEHIRGIDMVVQEAILNVPNVQAITNFSSVYDNTTRTYTIEICTVETVFGEVAVKGVAFSP